jgi:hypothetical protein
MALRGTIIGTDVKCSDSYPSKLERRRNFGRGSRKNVGYLEYEGVNYLILLIR